MKHDFPCIRAGEALPVRAASASDEAFGVAVRNLVNGFGLTRDGAGNLLHDNHPDGDTMWCTGGDPARVRLEFDLGLAVPLDRMEVWNYNRGDAAGQPAGFTDRGLREISVLHSLDGREWTPLRPDGGRLRLARADGRPGLRATNLDDGTGSPIAFGNVQVRYVAIEADPQPGIGNWGGTESGKAVFGLSAVRFLAGRGLYALEAPEWSGLFRRHDGWTGADAAYSLPLTGRGTLRGDGTPRFLFSFSDTMVGSVDPATGRRDPHSYMISSSHAVLEGGRPDPDRIRFVWGKDGACVREPAFVPRHHGDGSYYWFQGGIAVGDRVHLLALVVRSNPEGREGFRFKVDNVDVVSLPLGTSGPDFSRGEMHPTPFRDSEAALRQDIFFNCAVLDHTENGASRSPDGYVYIYGTLRDGFGRGLVAARVRPEAFLSFDSWRFFDGAEWGTDPARCAILAGGVSWELSVQEMDFGIHAGRYLLVYQEFGVGRYIVCQAGDTPMGPFDKPIRVCHSEVEDRGMAIYTYNAKGHAALSGPGELLVSSNVNTRSEWANMADGHIYRPRWLRLLDTTAPPPPPPDDPG